MEQRTFTPGKIVIIGRKAKRKKGKRADYILRYSQNFPIAVIEAKKKYKSAGDGMVQAKDRKTIEWDILDKALECLAHAIERAEIIQMVGVDIGHDRHGRG